MNNPETSTPKVAPKETAPQEMTPKKMVSREVAEAGQPTTFFGTLWPIGVLIFALISIQIGASAAKTLFSQISPLGLTTLRISFAAIMLACVFRVWRIPLKPEARRPTLFYGIFLAGMNMFFYLSLVRIPLGLAVGVAFLGPLCLALRGARTWLDLLWAVLAALGLFVLSPLNALATDIDPLGILFALITGCCWACYIIYGKRAGTIQGASVAAFGTIIAALCTIPTGIYFAGWQLLNPAILPLALVVSLFSSAIPYCFEIIALTRMPQQTYSLLLSSEPAFAALFGFILLGEYLSTTQCLALVAICFASIGSTLARLRTYIK